MFLNVDSTWVELARLPERLVPKPRRASRSAFGIMSETTRVRDGWGPPWMNVSGARPGLAPERTTDRDGPSGLRQCASRESGGPPWARPMRRRPRRGLRAPSGSRPSGNPPAARVRLEPSCGRESRRVADDAVIFGTEDDWRRVANSGRRAKAPAAFGPIGHRSRVWLAIRSHSLGMGGMRALIDERLLMRFGARPIQD